MGSGGARRGRRCRRRGRGRAGCDGAFVLRRLHPGHRRVPVGGLRRGPRGVARGARRHSRQGRWRRWQPSMSVRDEPVDPSEYTPTSARISARSATSAAPTSSAVSSSASGPRAPAAPITWIWKLPCAPASPRPVSRRSASRRRGSAPPAATTFTSRIAKAEAAADATAPSPVERNELVSIAERYQRVAAEVAEAAMAAGRARGRAPCGRVEDGRA